jgi:hypothetical protein
MDGGSLYTEEREGMARKCLPVEDLDEHLYIHPGTVTVAAFTVGSEETRYYVGAQDFMEMQRERDELRRTLSLINAIRATKGEFAEKWERACDLLQGAGFDGKQAQAMAGLIAWAKEANGG